MKIIVDTNVLVSAIIRDNIPEQVIMWIVSQPVIEWVATAEIVQEYKEVLERKKFKLPSDVIDSWLRLFMELKAGYKQTEIGVIPEENMGFIWN